MIVVAVVVVVVFDLVVDVPLSVLLRWVESKGIVKSLLGSNALQRYYLHLLEQANGGVPIAPLSPARMKVRITDASRLALRVGGAGVWWGRAGAGVGVSRLALPRLILCRVIVFYRSRCVIFLILSCSIVFCFICLSACRPACRPAGLPACLSVRLYLCPSVYLYKISARFGRHAIS